MPCAVFRCDATPALGGGHAGRCLALARRLIEEGWNVCFAVNPEAPETVPSLHDFDLIALTKGGDPEALRAARPEGCDLLAVDHYGLDATYESALRGWAGRVLVIDDLADRVHDADILLDQTLGREAADYKGLVPDACTLLLGPDHAILRDQFRRARPLALARRIEGPARRLLIACGLGDHLGLTLRVLEALATVPNSGLEVDIVIGGAAPNLDEVRRCAAALPDPVTVRTDVADMAGAMLRADLCVGAAGTSSWERCALGLPSLYFTAVANQERIARALAASGAGLPLGAPGALSSEEIADRLTGLAADSAERAEMARCAARICDGRGAGRVLNAVAPGETRDGAAIRLRPATPADSETIFDWQSDPTTRVYFRNPAPPSRTEHEAWFTSRMGTADPAIEIIEVKEHPVGLLRLDPTSDGYEVSILTAPDARGRGIGRAALCLLRRLEPEATLTAVVHPDNAASRAMFRAAGYHETGPETMVLSGRTGI